MKLTDELKRMLNALAYAHAAENLTLKQKASVLKGTSTEPKKPEARPAVASGRPQVALYMGSELPADVMHYVMQTCARLNHGLTVLTFQTETDARALLAPYEAALDESGIAVRVVALTGEPPASLARALRRQPGVAFLVCNESGYLGRGLLNGTQRSDAFPVPVVLVAANGKATSLETEQGASRSRAA